MSRTCIRLITCGLLLILLGGCAGYAPLQNEEAVKVALKPILSQTEIPQFIAPLSRNLREQLNHNAGWLLVDEDSAEVLLIVRILGMQRKAVSRDPSDTGRPLSYLESVRVSVEWISDIPAPWAPEPVTFIEADSLIYAQGGLISAESVILTELADDISRKILERLNRIN